MLSQRGPRNGRTSRRHFDDVVIAGAVVSDAVKGRVTTNKIIKGGVTGAVVSVVAVLLDRPSP
jgi:hypothetical protein